MSTKIHNGYKLAKKDLTFTQIKNFCHKVRDTIKPIAEDEFSKTVAKICFKVIDKNQFGFYTDAMYFVKNYGGEVVNGVFKYVEAKKEEHKYRRDPELDYDFSFTVIPLKNKTLMLLFTQQRKLTEAFEAIEGVKDYHYQNQCDRPERISSTEWRQRERDWDSALGGNGYATPAESGLSYTPYNGDFLFSRFNIQPSAKHFPSVQKRAESIAFDIHWKEYREKNPITSEGEKKSVESTALYFKFIDFVQTAEGKKERKKIEKSVKSKLQFKNITTFKELSDIVIKLNPELENHSKTKPYWLNK